MLWTLSVWIITSDHLLSLPFCFSYVVVVAPVSGRRFTWFCHHAPLPQASLCSSASPPRLAGGLCWPRVPGKQATPPLFTHLSTSSSGEEAATQIYLKWSLASPQALLVCHSSFLLNRTCLKIGHSWLDCIIHSAHLCMAPARQLLSNLYF